MRGDAALAWAGWEGVGGLWEKDLPRSATPYGQSLCIVAAKVAGRDGPAADMDLGKGSSCFVLCALWVLKTMKPLALILQSPKNQERRTKNEKPT